MQWLRGLILGRANSVRIEDRDVADRQKVAEWRISKTQPFVFSADEGVDVGGDNETIVSTTTSQIEQFTDKIIKAAIDTKA